MGILSRALARDWVASELKTHVGDLDWSDADSLDALMDILSGNLSLSFLHYCRNGSGMVRLVNAVGRPVGIPPLLRRRFRRLSPSFVLRRSAIFLALVTVTFEHALCP